jgi:hypothetical protein
LNRSSWKEITTMVQLRMVPVWVLAVALGGCAATGESSWGPTPGQNPPASDFVDAGPEVASQTVGEPSTGDAGAPQADAVTPPSSAPDAGPDGPPSTGSPIGQDAQVPSSTDAGQPTPDVAPAVDAGPTLVVVTCIVPNVGTYSSVFSETRVRGQPFPVNPNAGYYIGWVSAGGQALSLQCSDGACDPLPQQTKCDASGCWQIPVGCPSGSPCVVQPPVNGVAGTCE